MNARTIAISLGLVFSSLVAGCATAVDDEGVDAIDTTESAVVSCGSTYAEAFAYYKKAVDASKDRLRYGVCESENGLLWGIADDASRAVMTCGAFREVIATSPWALPLRQVLVSTLTYRSLTGELLVIKDSEWQNWTGVEPFFDAGLTFWARAQGAYGSSVQVDFGPNGTATWGEHTYDEGTGEVGWRTIPATYTIEKSSGSQAGPRVLTVTREGKTDVFALGVQNAVSWKDAPIFVLEPLGTGEVLGDGATAPKLYSLVSECDA